MGYLGRRGEGWWRGLRPLDTVGAVSGCLEGMGEHRAKLGPQTPAASSGGGGVSAGGTFPGDPHSRLGSRTTPPPPGWRWRGRGGGGKPPGPRHPPALDWAPSNGGLAGTPTTGAGRPFPIWGVVSHPPPKAASRRNPGARRCVTLPPPPPAPVLPRTPSAGS